MHPELTCTRARARPNRGRLAEYAKEHDAEISTGKSEADALLREYAALDFSGLEESQSELASLAAARVQQDQLLAAQKKEARIVEFLQELVALYQFEAEMPASLAQGRQDPAKFAEMAGKLASMRNLVEHLPKRNGKPPAINKEVAPMVRDMAKRLRAGVRTCVSTRIAISQHTIRVRLVPVAGKKAGGAGGRGGAGDLRSAALCECLEAMDLLMSHEDESGGRKGGAAGSGGAEEMLEGIIEGVIDVLQPLVDGAACSVCVSSWLEEAVGKQAEEAASKRGDGSGAHAHEENEARLEAGDDKWEVFELKISPCSGGEDGEDAEASDGGAGGAGEGTDGCLARVSEALEFVVLRVLGGDGTAVGGKGRVWVEKCVERVWGVLVKGLSGVFMSACPGEVHAFHAYHSAMLQKGMVLQCTYKNARTHARTRMHITHARTHTHKHTNRRTHTPALKYCIITLLTCSHPASPQMAQDAP